NEVARLDTPLRPFELTTAVAVLTRDTTRAWRVVRPNGSLLATFENGTNVATGAGGEFATTRYEGGASTLVRQFDPQGTMLAESIVVGVDQSWSMAALGRDGVLLQEPRPSGDGPLRVRFLPVDGSAGWERVLPALRNATAVA